MQKTWSELYTTFARLAAMVPNAEANVCCEELCDRILNSGIGVTLKVKSFLIVLYIFKDHNAFNMSNNTKTCCVNFRLEQGWNILRPCVRSWLTLWTFPH